MADPGEVAHSIGRAYGLALVGCLEVCVRGFRRIFEVNTSPDKLSFILPDQRSFSFDFGGVIERNSTPAREVLIETKGHTYGTDLLPAYREFVVRSMTVSATVTRHANDLFWFVANVPFGSSFGRGLTQPTFLRDCFSASTYKELLWPEELDFLHACDEFAQRLAIAILPDSFMRLTGVRYRVEQDDNLWVIMQRLHGGIVPVDEYAPVVETIAQQNELENPDVIQPLSSVHLPWFGIPQELLSTTAMQLSPDKQ